MIDACLFGDGNLKKILPIDDSMGSLDGFDKNLKLLSDVKELKTFTTYATFASNLVLREAGTMSSTDQASTALSDMNKWTDSAKSGSL